MSTADEETNGVKGTLNYPNTQVMFPDLETCAANLLNKLMDDEIEDFKVFDYPTLIRNSGGLEKTVADAMAQIEPEILELQGKVISPKIFLEAQRKQFARRVPWPEIGGYVDGITDDRHDEYIRFYVGQSFNLPVRVSIDHPGEIRNGNTSRLHYFVAARGQGHRCAHFLRLWAAANLATDGLESMARNRFYLSQNVLKMTFCRAFESLPGTILTWFFGAASYSNVGLNNLPPLFQGVNIPASVRAKYTEHHRTSPDADISAFVDIRRKQNAQFRTEQTRVNMLLRGDYRRLIEELVEEVGLNPASLSNLASLDRPATPIDVRRELQTLELEVAKRQDREAGPCSAPIGNLQAKIGIVLNSESTSVKYDGHDIEPLVGLRLTEENSLVWTSSFERLGSEPSNSELHSRHQDQVDRFNRLLIIGSCIRVVVLCGLRVQHDILRAFQHQLSGPHHLRLRTYRHTVWFLSSAKDISKLFVVSPEPLATSFLGDLTQTRQLKDIFGLTSTLTDVKIKYNFWENACFYAALFAQVRREKDGAEPLTTTALRPVFRDWLYCRGFVDDADIRELEDTAGGLTLGLLQILSVLSNRSRGRTGIHSEHYRGYQGKYDAASFEKTVQLFDRIQMQHMSRIDALRRLNDKVEPREDDVNALDDAILIREEEVADNPIIRLISDAFLDVGNDGEPVSQQSSKPISSYEWKKTREMLEEMLSDEGTRVQARSPKQQGNRDKRWELSTCRRLVKFTVYPEVGIQFCAKPIFAMRARLSKPMELHPDRVLGDLREYIPSDPALRLAIQYRLVDNKDGKPPSQIWHWASLGEKTTTTVRSVLQERIFKANTLVDLLEGRTATELEDIPRRSLRPWILDRAKEVESE